MAITVAASERKSSELVVIKDVNAPEVGLLGYINVNVQKFRIYHSKWNQTAAMRAESEG